MSNPNESLVPIKPAGEQPVVPSSTAALVGVLGATSEPFYCSFDLSTVEGRKLLFKMDDETDFEVASMKKQRIKLQHLYAAPAEKLMPTGEVVALTRIVLIDDQGKTYGCFSKGIRSTIAKLVGGYGMPPWKPPLVVEVYGVKTQHPGDLLKLRVIEEEPAKGAKAK